ncbi:MAG: hypothetical protein ACKOWF_01555 [Chloroflexota bacterium]
MDQSSFDRITRLLGGATTRRAGVRAAVAGLLGFPSTIAAGMSGPAADAAGGAGRRSGKDGGSPGRAPKPEGPCGNGSRKDNVCTKDKQCCTGLCHTKAGKHNTDGKGRCRCLRNGRPCTEDRNCCKQSCVSGRCNGTLPPTPAVPTGQPCASTDTCVDPNASCTTYQHDLEAGTHCLLPRRALCSGDGQCVSSTCTDGVCAPCGSPACGVACNAIVCATCTHQTVQAAIAAAAPGAIIDIGAGTYSEDLTIAKDLTLRACGGTRVVLKNASYNSRTITVTGQAKLALVDIIVDAYKDLAANPKKAGGGIATDGDLALYGASVIQNAGGWNSGGGFAVIPASGSSASITITDRATVRANRANWEGAGGLGKGQVTVVVDQEAAIRDNVSDSYSAGLNLAGNVALTIADDAVIDGNVSEFNGAAILLGPVLGQSYEPCSMVIRDRARISNNVSRQGNGALYCDGGLQDNRSTIHITGNARFIGNTGPDGGAAMSIIGYVTLIDGDVEISGNTQTGISAEVNERGGAILFTAFTSSPAWPAGATGLTIGGNARVVNNTTPQGGGAIYLFRSPATITDSAVISGNSASGSANGGGVLISNNGDTSLAATLTVSGQARITGNSAAGGGGVYSLDAGNTLTAASGSITGNTPDNCAGTGISC